MFPLLRVHGREIEPQELPPCVGISCHAYSLGSFGKLSNVATEKTRPIEKGLGPECQLSRNNSIR